METETASYRSTEARHSRPVRWIINQVGSVREKLEAGTVASVDESQAWPDSSFRNKTRISPKKRSVSSFQQAELWPSDAARKIELPMAVEPVVETVAASPKNMIEEIPFVEVKKLRKPAPRVVVSERRKVVTVSGIKATSTTSQSLRVNSIARFLNVNGAIEGLKTGGIHFDIANRGGLQALRLWKGSPETSTFISA